MDFNIDVVIVSCFLFITLIAGVVTGRGIKNISQYAIGNRDFNTLTISATIIATWISGGIFSMAISETYANGLYFIIPLLGDAFVFLIIGLVLAPRMGQFLGKLSVAEAIGDLYGKTPKLITAVVGIFGCAGEIAIQFKVSSVLLQMFFGFSNLYAMGISTFVVIFYSAFGGIRSVTFTDLIQFFTFGTIVPIITLVIWGTFDDPSTIFQTLSNNHIFDYTQVFNYQNPKFFGTITLMLFFALPHMYPVLFQRISMAQNTKQVTKSFIIAAAVCLIIELIICIVGILLYSKNPNLQPDTLFPYILDNYSYVGFKGIVVAGIMAMVMSTTDSYINSAAVMFSHDLCKPLGFSKKIGELLISRMFSAFIGIIAFILAFNSNTIIELGMMVWSFYIPIVTVPLVSAIFGFRTTATSFMISTISGLLMVLIWRSNFMHTGVDSVIPGMLVNIIFFFGTHYIFKQKGGWGNNNIENNLPAERESSRLRSILQRIRNFNLENYLLNNAPNNESVYSIFGFFAIVTVYSTMFAIDINIRNQYFQIIEIIYHSVLILSSIFLTYPVWPKTFKNKLCISVLWFISLFYILVFVAVIHVIISSFGQFQLMVLLLSLVVLSTLIKWQLALLFITTGVTSSICLFKFYYEIHNISIELGTLQFKIMYLLLLVSSVLLAFIKPKQDYLEATEAKVDTLESEVTHLDHELVDLSGKVMHYSQRVADHEKEIERLGSTAQRILNNVNHELRLPIGNVVNFSDMLHETLQEKYDDKLLKDLSEEVFKNSTRVSTMILNMLDLATLEVRKVDLNKKTINFGELVEDRVKHCRKIYLQGKKIDFELSIQPEVMIAVDPNYVRQMVDNIVINAITYTAEGTIKVYAYKVGQRVELIIEDQGMGIPLKDIYDIFDPFKMGSKTESKAEGRGLGLALCKSVAEAHGGKITAESNGKIGAKFTIVFPY